MDALTSCINDFGRGWLRNNLRISHSESCALQGGFQGLIIRSCRDGGTARGGDSIKKLIISKKHASDDPACSNRDIIRISVPLVSELPESVGISLCECPVNDHSEVHEAVVGPNVKQLGK